MNIMNAHYKLKIVLGRQKMVKLCVLLTGQTKHSRTLSINLFPNFKKVSGTNLCLCMSTIETNVVLKVLNARYITGYSLVFSDICGVYQPFSGHHSDWPRPGLKYEGTRLKYELVAQKYSDLAGKSLVILENW